LQTRNYYVSGGDLLDCSRHYKLMVACFSDHLPFLKARTLHPTSCHQLLAHSHAGTLGPVLAAFCVNAEDADVDCQHARERQQAERHAVLRHGSCCNAHPPSRRDESERLAGVRSVNC
jgi:hypothetical protein